MPKSVKSVKSVTTGKSKRGSIGRGPGSTAAGEKSRRQRFSEQYKECCSYTNPETGEVITYSFMAGAKEMILYGPLNIFLPCTIIAFISEAVHWPSGVTFAFSLVAIAPFAERLGYVTEQIALHTNDTIGGLLNATFGNATEFIVAVSALSRGLYRLVQLSLLGSVVSNILLVLGTAFIVGGYFHKFLMFKTVTAELNNGLLLLGAMGVLFPTVLTWTSAESIVGEVGFSRATSVILFITYVAFLYFQIATHPTIYDDEEKSDDDDAASAHALLVQEVTALRTALQSKVKSRSEKAGDGDVGDGNVGGGGAPATERQTSPDRNFTSPKNSAQMLRVLREDDITLVEDEGGLPVRRSPGTRRATAQGRVGDIEDGPAPVLASNTRRGSGHGGSRVIRSLSDLRAGGHVDEGDSEDPELDGDEDEEEGEGGGGSDDEDEEEEEDTLGFWYAILWLTAITVFISFLSDALVASLEDASKDWHVSSVFLSTIVLPIIGNAAEHASSIMAAAKNKCELSLGIAVGSSTQISLCVLPLLVIVGWGMGKPMSLNFLPFEAFSWLTSIMMLGYAISHGRATWIIGVTMVAAYFVIAFAFFVHNDEDLKGE